MAGGVVYDGVAGGKGGSLFEGLKLWIAIRVPIRKELVRMVEDNGGEVVKLEKQADILIADHARKDAPPGSHSWSFIDESVKKGRLEQIENHLISPPVSDHRLAASLRPVGSARPPRGVRNLFTKEDDAVLMKWVALQERRGEPISGNVIYQQLAEKHPNHTWQSWRDRWVKKLSFLPRPNLCLDEDEDNVENGTDDAPEPSPSPTVAQVAARKPDAKDPAIKKTGSKTRKLFTEEDDELLRSYVHECAAAGLALGGNKIYIEFARQHPHRPFHSWRDRWLRHLSKRLSPDLTRPPRIRTPSPNRPRVTVVDRPSASGLRRSPRVRTPPSNHPRVPDVDRPAASGSGPSIPARLQQNGEDGTSPISAPTKEGQSRQESPAPNVRRREIHETEEDADGAAVQADLVRINEEARRAITSFQPLVRGALTRIALQYEEDDDDTAPEAHVPAEDSSRRVPLASTGNRQAPPPAKRTESQIFYSDLRDFIEYTGSEVVFWPTVQKRTLSLWDLWRSARAQDQPPTLRNWEDIAESLGFDWVSFPSVTTDLKNCFDANLGTFETVIDDWNNDEDEPEGGEELGDHELDADDNGEELSDHALLADDDEMSEEVQPTPEPITAVKPTFASSPPQIQGLKRRLEPELYASSSPRKRVKYASDSEIPSTPHEKTGVANLRSLNDLGISPSERSLTRVSNLIESLIQELPSLRQLSAKKEPENRPSGQPESPIIGGTPISRLQSKSRLVDPIPLAFSPKVTGTSSPVVRRTALRAGPATTSEASRRQLKERLAVTSRSRAADRRSLPLSLHRPTQNGTSAASQSRFSIPVARAELTDSPRQHPHAQPTPKLTLNHAPISKPRKTGGSTNDVAPPNPSSSANGVAAGTDLVSTVERFMSMGYPQSIVIQGLKATSMNPGEAGVVMESLMAGKGLPGHHEGVWTKRDDDSLELVNSTDLTKLTRDPDEVDAKRRALKERKRLELKHGAQRIKARADFLNAWGRP